MAQHARDEAGNVWDVSNPNNPVLVTPAQSGGIITKRADPKYEYEAPQAAATLAEATARAQKAAAQSPYNADIAKAERDSAVANASLATGKADEARASAAIAAMVPTSNLHGEAYFNAIHLPESQRVLARAYARGDLGSRSGGMTTSMLPIIQHAMNYDPSTSATTFPARVKMQQDLASKEPGSAGGSLRAMEQMLLHGSNVLTSGQTLNNFGPGLFGTIGNDLRTGYLSRTGDADVNRYNQEVKNYAPESQKGVAGAAGIGAEREERAAGYAAAMPQAARVSALQADAKMAMERMGAVNDQYRRLMGRDITDQMSPEAKKAYDLIMAGGYDDKGNPLFPAKGYMPGSVLKSDGPTTPPPPDNSGMSSSSGTPTFNPNGGGSFSDAAGKMMSDKLAAAYRGGAGIDELNALVTANGYKPFTDPEQIKHVQARDPLNFAVTPLDPERSTASKIAAAVMGTGIGGKAGAYGLGAVDAATGGYLDELTGGQTQLAKDYAANEHPIASLLGDASGGAAAMLPISRGMEAIGAGSRIGSLLVGNGARAAATGDALYGGILGSGEDNDNRIAGLLSGAATGLGGNLAGNVLVRGAGAAVRGVADPAVQYLTDRGIPLTMGQTLGNRGIVGRTMNKLESLPVLDSLIGARRADAGEAYVRGTINDALDPIGGTVTSTGQQAIGSAQGQVGQAYRDALSGVNVTADPQFVSEMAGAMFRGRAIPVQGEQFGHVMDSQVGPLFGPGGSLDGDTAQAALQAVRQAGSDFNGEGAMGRLAANETGNVDDAISSLLTRQAPQAAQGLADANAAYARLAPLNDAAITAVNNGGIYTPAQSIRAVTSNTKNFGGKAAAAQGQNITDLMRYGQEVLPSTSGNSGSADRIAAMLLPSLLSGGAGYEALAGGHDAEGHLPTSALVLGALAAASSRTGGRIIQHALVDRPDAVRQIGQLLADRSRVGSMVATPLALGYEETR